MTLNNIKRSIASVWVLGIGAAGLLAGISSAASSLVLLAVAIVPPLAMMRYWNDPTPTMSESIREAQR